MVRNLGVFLVTMIRRQFCNCTPTARVLSDANGQKWEICVSLALIRPPVIAPPLSDVEKRYQACAHVIDVERSYLSDFELKEADDKKFLEMKANQTDVDKLAEQLSEQRITTDFLERNWKQYEDSLRKKYRLDDLLGKQDDVETSLNRELHQQLVLVVRQRFRRADYISPWIIPQIRLIDGETLKETTERCLSELFQCEIDGSINNSPFSMITHKYARGIVRKGSSDCGVVGAKIFFFNAFVSSKNRTFDVDKNEIADYKWVTSNEFRQLVHSSRYKNALSTLFVDW